MLPLIVLKKSIKYIEILTVFLGVPLLYYFNLIPFHKAIPLIAVFLFYFIIIISDKTFNRKRLWINGYKGWKELFIKSAIIGSILFLVVFIFYPDKLFNIPREMPWIWLLIMLFYPLWSVLPQEFIYRVYFYHRFNNLWGGKYVQHLINALLFSFSHIIFRNWLVLVFTFLASLLFSYTFTKTKSLMAVFIEHAIYGNMVFTMGLGEFFYLPIN